MSSRMQTLDSNILRQVDYRDPAGLRGAFLGEFFLIPPHSRGSLSLPYFLYAQGGEMSWSHLSLPMAAEPLPPQSQGEISGR